jgi:hypothetical protein
MKLRMIWHCCDFKLHLARLYKLDQIKSSSPCLKPPLPHPPEIVCSRFAMILLLFLQSSHGSVYIYESIGFSNVFYLERVPMQVRSKRNDGGWGFLEHWLHTARKVQEARLVVMSLPSPQRGTPWLHHATTAPRSHRPRGIPHHSHQWRRALLDHRGHDNRHKYLGS